MQSTPPPPSPRLPLRPFPISNFSLPTTLAPRPKVSSKLASLVREALEQEPMIVASFIEVLLTRAAVSDVSPAGIEGAELCRMLRTTLQAFTEGKRSVC